MDDLRAQFKKVSDEMMKEFGYKNVMAVPKLEKVTINTGIGEKVKGKSSDRRDEIVNYVVNDIGLISGQKPVVAKAKKSIAGFGIREGDPVGVRVTLRGDRMYNFLEKLINIIIPGLRDFRGLETSSIDKSGNFSFGIEEHIYFPEIPADKRDDIFSLQITVTNTAKTKEEGLALLRKLGFPFKK